MPSTGISQNGLQGDVTPMKTSVSSIQVEQNYNLNRENVIQYVHSPMHLVLTPSQYTTLMNSFSSPPTSLSLSPFQCVNSANSPKMFIELTEKAASPLNIEEPLSSVYPETKVMSSAGQKRPDETAVKSSSNKHAIVSRQLNMTR